jgi:hypothetical protein
VPHSTPKVHPDGSLEFFGPPPPSPATGRKARASARPGRLARCGCYESKSWAECFASRAFAATRQQGSSALKSRWTIAETARATVLMHTSRLSAWHRPSCKSRRCVAPPPPNASSQRSSVCATEAPWARAELPKPRWQLATVAPEVAVLGPKRATARYTLCGSALPLPPNETSPPQTQPISSSPCWRGRVRTTVWRPLSDQLRVRGFFTNHECPIRVAC